MRNVFTIGFSILLFAVALSAHDNHPHGRTIEFPNLPGYVTLKCDFHQHSVFSDGDVWPTIRVQEAVKDGLDAMALTEHLEYQPHKADIPHPDRNRAYELALKEAKETNLIVINGSEITRRMPPGHSNAIFLQDANKMLIPDSIEVFREAKRQSAFTFWNHPNWLGQSRTGIASLTDMHKYLLKEKLLDGIEVVNDVTYSDEALQIALDYNLTMMGSSDIHGLIDWQFDVPSGGHRPVTLVFAKTRTAEGIKEALFDRRTVVYFNNTLIGREQFLLPLIQQCITVHAARYEGKSSVMNVTLENTSGVEFILKNSSEYSLHENSDVLTLRPFSETTIEVKAGTVVPSVQLLFDVLNAVTAPKTHPSLSLTVSVQ